MERFLRKIVLAGLYIVPFIVFVVSSSMFFPFITGKNFAFRILVEIVFALWVILAIYYPAYRPKKSWIGCAIVIFVAMIGVSDIFGENLFKSFWSNFERMEGFVSLIHLLGYFFVASAMLNTEKLWKRWLQTSVGVSVLIGIYGILQLAGTLAIHQGGVRLDATFGNASYLAVYMLFHIFFTLWLIYKHSGSNILRYGYWIALALQIFILYHTATRGTILGLVGGLFLSAILVALFSKENKTLRKFAVGGVIGIIVLVGAFFAIKDTDLVAKSGPLARIASISLENDAGTSRFLIWNAAWQGVKEHPVLGWGQENFIYVFGKYYNIEMYDEEPWFDRAHNIVFDWLVAGGVVGLILYLSILFFALFYLWRGTYFSVFEKSLFTGLIAGYTFHNLFVFDNLTSYILFFSLLALISARVTGGSVKQDSNILQDTRSLSDTSKHALTSIIIIAFVFGVYFVNVKPILASRSLLNALAPHEEGIEVNLEFYLKTISYNTIGRQEAREQLSHAAATASSLNIPVDLKIRFAESAREELLKEIEGDQNNPRYPFFLGAFLTRIGAYDEGRAWFDRALELSKDKQLTLLEKGMSYVAEGKYSEASEVLKYTFELSPEYSLGRVGYALASIYLRNFSLADELINDIPFSDIANDGRFVNAYVSVGATGRVVDIWEFLAEQNSTDAQTHVSLGAAYFNAGRVSDAISSIERAIELDARFTEQGQQIIENIRSGRGL